MRFPKKQITQAVPKPLNEQLRDLRRIRDVSSLDMEAMTNLNNQTVSRLELGRNYKTIELINEYLCALCAHLEVVQDPLPEYSEETLETICKSGDIRNYHELHFFKSYFRARSDSQKGKAIRDYTSPAKTKKRT